MLCLLKTRWQARALRWIVSLKVALYAGLFVSFINEVLSFGGSSCNRHIMIGKTATRLTFLGQGHTESHEHCGIIKKCKAIL